MRTTQTVGGFAKELLNKMNDPANNYFATLETLPDVVSLAKVDDIDRIIDPENPTYPAIEIAKHPLILIESQLTLFRLQAILQDLSGSTVALSKDNAEENLAALKNELLLKRRNRLRVSASDEYFYGTTLSFKANPACIEVAQQLERCTEKKYAYYLIPDLIDTLDEQFSFEGCLVSEAGASDADGVTLVKRMEPAHTQLSGEEGHALYQCLYGGMCNIPDLIERLYEKIPQNTWELYLANYYTEDLLFLAIVAIDKPMIKPGEGISDEEYAPIKKRVQTYLSDRTTHQNDLRSLVSANQQRATFKLNDEKWIKATYFVLISLAKRIRHLLGNTLGVCGTWTGVEKEKRLEEADVLLSELASDKPLKEFLLGLQATIQLFMGVFSLIFTVVNSVGFTMRL